MMILNKPKCQGKDCEEDAIGRFNGFWLCGRCIEKYNKKLMEAKQKIMFEE